jgi:hypothetical protein
MRTHEQLVVLLPRLDQFAIAIDHVDDVIPARLACGILLGHVVARRVSRRNEGAVIEGVRLAPLVLQHRQAAAVEDEHAVGRLRPDARGRADLVAFAAVVLRPAFHHIVRPGYVVAALFLRHLGEHAHGGEEPERRERGTDFLGH